MTTVFTIFTSVAVQWFIATNEQLHTIYVLELFISITLCTSLTSAYLYFCDLLFHLNVIFLYHSIKTFIETQFRDHQVYDFS